MSNEHARSWRRRIGLALFVLLAVCVAAWASIRPSNDRVWSADQAVLPHVEFHGDSVTVHRIRNVRYETTDRYEVAHYDRTFDLRRLESVWFMVEPFAGFQGPAHTLVSFGFQGGEYVAISVEVRKETGEEFSPLKGVLRQYELMYVVADERDVLKLRSNYRHDDVFLYPMRSTPEQRRALFVDMLERADRLREHPEFYNTLTSTCTTNIVRHVNRLAPGRIPLSWKVLLPGYSDELAMDVGLIDTDLPLAEARRRFRINDRALQYADSPDFSTRIREAPGSAR
jgi:hypothetical protein